uniref:Uncharacterized protein n=1 Tax=Yersinia enterocolitica TaxID=630 RepID=B0RKZ0_YEREN|nr:hypothetical protein [Yersinia enterocolitica]
MLPLAARYMSPETIPNTTIAAINDEYWRSLNMNLIRVKALTTVEKPPWTTYSISRDAKLTLGIRMMSSNR